MSHDTPVSPPRLPTPPGACDTHLHIYEPGYDMRASASHPSQPGTLTHYREIQRRLGLTRAVIVQPSAYGTDNTCTLDAMGKLLDLVAEWTQDEKLRKKILVENPARLYGFK